MMELNDERDMAELKRILNAVKGLEHELNKGLNEQYMSQTYFDEKFNIIEDGWNKLKRRHPETVYGQFKTDCTPESPRDWDNLGTIVYVNDRYIIGDEKFNACLGNSFEDAVANYFAKNYPNDIPFDINERDADDELIYWEWDCLTEEGVEKVLKWVDENFVILPLYIFEHSGISLHVGQKYGWDYSNFGFIYAYKPNAVKYIGTPDDDWWKTYHAGESVEQVIEDILRGEIEVMDDYLRGNVWCLFTYADPDGENDIDVICGYYGDTDKLRDELEKEYGIDEWLDDDYSC